MVRDPGRWKVGETFRVLGEDGTERVYLVVRVGPDGAVFVQEQFLHHEGPVVRLDGVRGGGRRP